MTLYIDAGMGAAGDMLTAALVETFGNKEQIVKELNGLGVPGVTYSIEKSEKCGICGTHMVVICNGEEEGTEGEIIHHHEHEHHEHAHEHDHHHSHSSLHDIEHIVKDHIHVTEDVQKDIMAVYSLIAKAESHVHGEEMDQIHFHEVGTMDAVADVTAVCYLLSKIKAQRIVVSPIHVGSGTVRCAHGILPVPAPATAYILQDCPIYSTDIKGELCTPTGAALLKHFATEFENMPAMKISNIGYGMGKKDFPRANAVRVLVGEESKQSNRILELECNIDDMTAEELGFAMERLLEEGALEAFATPIIMKKSRPGHLLSVLIREEDKDRIVRLIFSLTSTIGIRETEHNRYVLDRRIEQVETSFGPVRKKVSTGYGVTKKKYEYDDLAAIARKNGLSLKEVKDQL